MTLLFAARLLQLLAAVLAVMLRRHVASHTPVAVLLVGGTLANVARILLQQLVVIPAIEALGGNPALGIPPAEPLSGWARVAAHADHGLQLGWSAGMAVAAIVVFYVSSTGDISELHLEHQRYIMEGERRNRVVELWIRGAVVACVWAPMVAFFAGTYPETRELHQQGYLLADMLAIAAGGAAFVQWVRWSKAEFGITERCMLYVLGFNGLALLGPHLAQSIYTSWDKATAVFAVLYLALSFVQVKLYLEVHRGR